MSGGQRKLKINTNNMHRLFIIIALVTAAALQAMAQQRTESQARELASEFFSGKTSKLKRAQTVAPQLVSLRRITGEAITDTVQPLYIYNSANGFVIVSGDERTPEVLGYSDRGQFDIENVPDGFRWLLKGYFKSIKSLPVTADAATIKQAKALNAKRSKAAASRSSISAMLDTYSIAWGQEPGSYSFPGSSSSRWSWYSNNTIAGCVATAMAQVMYYWYRKEGFQGNQTTTIPAYTTTTNKTSVAAKEAMTFSWSSMSSSSNSAVGQLMERAGCAVHMDYGTNSDGGSNAWIPEIPYALRTYFGYDKGIHLEYRMDYTAEEWEELIYNELAAGRPIVYGGAYTGIDNGSEDASGHCFVCDGYQSSTDKFHFNWGWDGSEDGYFTLNGLNPSSYDFNLYVDAVIGFQPDRSNAQYQDPNPQRLSVSDLTFSGAQSYQRASRTDDFTGVNIYNAVANRLNEPESMTGRAYYPDFDMGLGLYSSDGTLIKVLGHRHYGEVMIGDGWGNQFCWDGLNFGAELPYGDYTIKAISRVNGATDWQEDRRSDRHYITATISETQLTLTPSAYFVYSNGSLTNKGSEETTNNIYCWTNSSNMDGVQTAVAAGSSLSERSYSYISSDRAAKNMLYQSSSSTYIALSDSIGCHFDDVANTNESVVDGGVNGTLIGNDLNVKAMLANKKASGTYSGTVYASIGSSSTEQSKSVSVAAGKSTTVDFSFTGLSYGSEYTLTITAGSVSIDTTFTVRRGIVVGYGDGSESYVLDGNGMTIADNAVWVDARYTQNASSITPSSNTNCIYVLASGATTPSNLSGRNVVIGSLADNIELTDNQYGMDTPVEFTAQAISYKRTFTAGNTGTKANWSTMVLPFNCSTVSGDNCRGWFTSSSDKRKNIWVMGYSRLDGTKVYFKYAGSELEAYKPYIITVAGDKWGQSWNLVGKELTFSGINATISPRHRAITTSGDDDFVGRTFNLPRHFIYKLNDEGSNFAYTGHDTSFPGFRAYFLLFGTTAAQAKAMTIAIDNGTATGISALPAPTGKAETWTDLQGRRLKAEPTQRGIYIHGDKKIMVK